MSHAHDAYHRHSIELLDYLTSQLSAMEIKANTSRENYQRQLQVAAASGFMTDYTNVLGGDKFATFSRHIDSLVDMIDQSRRHMAAQRQIIEQLADDARNRGNQT